ncbi:hypothetical protein FRB90_006670, partial [Tulasnella sp. 427]
LTETTAQWRLTNRTPEYQVEKNPLDGRVVAVRVGHAKLLATPSSGPPTPMKPFALHRPSLTLLSRLCAAVPQSESVLPVGETGTGKTTAIQHLAQLLSRPLTVIDLSNQTASSDLLGGFKPIDARVPGTELQRRFVELFTATFMRRRMRGFWTALGATAITAKELEGSDSPRKRRKLEEETISTNASSEQDWRTFEEDVNTFEAQHILAKSKFVFTFVEGPLIKALRQGHWVLVDEINLASPETLEAVTPLLQSPRSSITLTEQGSLTPIPRHSSFRIFASMNPATDVGKKDLPPNLRSRFTELWVPPPDEDKEALLAIVKQYISHCSLADPAAIMDVAEFYAEVRRLTESRAIADGSNRRPHFSMRTLARALTFTADVTPVFGLRRALWEGCLMAFTMTLDAKSADIVKPLAERWILRGVKNVSSVLSSVPMLPKGLSRDDVVQRGPLPLQNTDDYILTPSVQRKLTDLSRIILTRLFPVLIEGPTSAGKTSAIQYLAQCTGHRFVRINNHEHTDIQEYLGTYVSDPDSGKLVFHDGLLVRALREGHWIVLDELNLAPTDVLESLNRLLDDNRELVIPETQEIVRPHPSFMLFATQNPASLYGGRKVLSRAFRNRPLEVHFTDVPQAELEVILSERCKIHPSRAQRIVAVFEELQKRRQTGRVFETKQGFATLRDLFRWANRAACSSSPNEHFVSAFQHLLQPHLAHLRATSNLIAHVGKAFVALGLVTLELYVPDTPLDPIVSHRCALEFWRGEESRLVSRIEELERRLEGVRARLKGIAMGGSGTADLGREPDLKLHALFNEIHLFLREVLSPEKVWDLGDGLERVGTFLGSVQGFLARLGRGYEALGDVALPVVQAVEL